MNTAAIKTTLALFDFLPNANLCIFSAPFHYFQRLYYGILSI